MQLLGDDPSIGHYLFLGSGDFHPIGLVLHTGKPLAMLDPYTGGATEMSLERVERILRQRFGLINSVDEANSFGILIGEKPGQMRRNLANSNEAPIGETWAQRVSSRARSYQP